ncbi:MAG: TIR domain-containing protein [Terracidiphilus sp.]
MHVFVSYAREDKRWLDPEYRFNLIPFLVESLRRHNVVFWFDTELKPGDEYKRNIDSEIDQARIAILVVSQHFLNSEFIESREMPRIADRAQQGKMIVIPVLVEPCDWSDYPFLSDRQMVPSSPLIEYTVSDPSWAKVKYQILDGLKAQLKRIREPLPAPEVRKPEPAVKTEAPAVAPVQPPPAAPVQQPAVTPVQQPAAAQYRPPTAGQPQAPAGAQFQPRAGAQFQPPAGGPFQPPGAAQYRPPAAQFRQPAGGQFQPPTGAQYRPPAAAPNPPPAGAQFQPPGAAQYRPPAGPTPVPQANPSPVYGAPPAGLWPQYAATQPPRSSSKVPQWAVGLGVGALVLFGIIGGVTYYQQHQPHPTISTGQPGGQGTPGAPSNGMEPYTSNLGRFSILFPGTPQQATQPVNLPGGESVTLYQTYVSQDSDNIAYTVMYNDYPSEYTTGIDPQAILKGARDGATKGRTLTDDEVISLNGIPGRAIRATGSDGFSYAAHIFLDGSRLYQVVVVSNQNHPATLTEEFLSSFKVF